MQKIDIKEIIEQRGLEAKEVANQLFPDNKYPSMALNRVIAGEGVLDANQISKLSLLSGLSISELYSGGNWTAKSNAGLHKFTNGEYTAELNTETWVTKIFLKESLFHESVIFHSGTPLDDYLEKLNEIITKSKSND